MNYAMTVEELLNRLIDVPNKKLPVYFREAYGISGGDIALAEIQDVRVDPEKVVLK